MVRTKTLRRTIWTRWELRLQHLVVNRLLNGEVMLTHLKNGTGFFLTPTEARRLSQKLSGDYRD